MSIKKRLYLSNLLMTFIPVIVVLIIASGCGLIYLELMYKYSPQVLGMMTALHEALDRSEAEYPGLRIIVHSIVIFLPTVVLAACVFTNRFLTRFIVRRIVKPLDLITDGVNRIKNGDLDTRIEYSPNDEFREVCEALNVMCAGLKETTEKAEKEERSRREVFAGLSHDLRSPLTSIRAYTDALIDGVPKTQESRMEYLRIIQRKELVIENMVNRLFLYAKMQLGDFCLEPKVIEVRAEIHRLLRETAWDNFTVHTDELSSACICCDEGQFDRIVMNICENSVKYSDKEHGNMYISSSADDNNVILTFRDDGPGVPDSALPRIFDAFYRGDSSRNGSDGGSGLGLAIVKRAADQMGARTDAKNDGGLVISLTIPASQAGGQDGK